MLTEAEAKTKWCPFARPGAYIHGAGEPANYVTAGNRDGNGRPDELAMCIGSSCMAWQWAETEEEYRPKYSEGGGPFPKPAGEGWSERDCGYYRKRQVRHGYCGAFSTTSRPG